MCSVEKDDEQPHNNQKLLQKNIDASSITLMECILAGSISGAAGVVVCHPMDVIRTHIQTAAGNTIRSNGGGGVRDTCRTIVRTQGFFPGLYRGMVGPLFAQALYKSLIFSTNSFVTTHVFTNSKKTNSTIFMSGVIAGSINSFVVAPVEMIRTRQILLATSSSNTFSSHTSFYRSLRDILAQGGYSSLWRGWVPALLRDGPGIGLYFLTFERTKSTLLDYTTSSIHRNNHAISCKLLAGSLAGIAFWTVALPIDTIKANVEASFHDGSTKCTSSWNEVIAQQMELLSKRGGIRFLFKAWPVALGRGIPAAAVTLTTFDTVSDWFIRHR
mmetsp:Transcript_12196/g.17575  ORF Transcript_12196/g.17575 Transcript_12196/m.17575 type:complete len:329 (-) Transcript_12196:57-1043(-)